MRLADEELGRLVPTIERYGSAEALGQGWDDAAGSWFRQRQFLTHAERHNACGQRYYLLRDGDRVLAGAILYTLRLDLLTFLRVPSPVTMHLLGVPVGIATPGYFGAATDRAELLRHVAAAERGLLIVLNADQGDDLPVGARCRMIPTLFLDLGFHDWAAYQRAMRALHRRRLRRILALGQRLEATRGGCSAFTEAHHALYRQVHGRASAKLENLSLDFFRHLPDRFRLTSYTLAGQLVSWTITVPDGDLFMYFFGGMDYGRLRETEAYLVGLAGIVREAIERRAPVLDLGQTAEEPKLRFGARLVEKEMYLCHHRRWVQVLLLWLRAALEFRGRAPRFHVFHAEGGAP